MPKVKALLIGSKKPNEWQTGLLFAFESQLITVQTSSMTNRMKLAFSVLSLFLVFALVFQSCTKDEFSSSGATQNLAVYLTDDPAQFDKVLVQINSVEVKLDTGEHRGDDDFGDRSGKKDDDSDDDRKGHDEFGQWDTLNVAPGQYDILSLRNGVDTLLAQGAINGTVRKIRIAIGAVTVVRDGVSYPVNLLPGVSNYLYIKVHKEHMRDSGSTKKLWIDFDISRSIIEINGKYYLRPVLKPFCDKNTGELKGVVLPDAARAIVRVYNAFDTATAIPGREGKFRIRGLSDGTYSVLYKASNGYRDTTITNVNVAKGKESELPKVTLKK